MDVVVEFRDPTYGTAAAVQIPLLIHWRDVEKDEAIEALVRRQAAKLDTQFENIISCRVAIERSQKANEPERSAPCCVLLDVTTPPEHELVVRREPVRGVLRTVVLDAFKAMRRQLQDLHTRQRGRPRKRLPESLGFVERLFADEGCGFVRAADGRELRFDRQSVVEGDWDRLAVGTEVRFAERTAHDGLRAIAVQAANRTVGAVSRSDGRGSRRRARR